MKTLTVRVLRRHIKKGNKDTITMCPIALALKDMGFNLPRVYACGSIRHTRNTYAEYNTMVANFIDSFDSGKPVSPFSFKLRIEE